MKELKKSAISAIDVVSNLLCGETFISEDDYNEVSALRGEMTKFYRKYTEMHDGTHKEDEVISYDGTLTDIQRAYITYVQAKETYDELFAGVANDAVNSVNAVNNAISAISHNDGYNWFNVEYLTEHGYPVAPNALCVTNKQLVSHVAKLYATALSDKQNVARAAALISEYVERVVSRVEQMKSWNVPITKEVVSGILKDVLSHETDPNVTNNVKAKVFETYKVD